MLVAGNYGEAGALDRFGRAYRLPPVDSGQNQLYDYGPPADSATVVVTIGLADPSLQFRACVVAATLDNGVGVTNEEQGRTIDICHGLRATWEQPWPTLQRYD